MSPLARIRLPLVALAIAAAFLLSAPFGAAHRSSGAALPQGTPGPPTGTVVAVDVQFQGTSISGHDTPSSGFATDFASPYDIGFNWTAHGGQLGLGAQVTVVGAEVQVTLLGYPAFTDRANEREPITSKTGTLNLTLDLTQDRYLVEGVYLLTALLLGPNDSAIWSGGFYIHVTAPYHLVALNTGLGGLVLFEIVAVLSFGRTRRRKEKRSGVRAPSGGS